MSEATKQRDRTQIRRDTIIRNGTRTATIHETVQAHGPHGPQYMVAIEDSAQPGKTVGRLGCAGPLAFTLALIWAGEQLGIGRRP